MRRLLFLGVILLLGCGSRIVERDRLVPCDAGELAADTGVPTPDGALERDTAAPEPDAGADTGPELVDPADACTRLESAYGARAAMLMETPFGCPATDTRCQYREGDTCITPAMLDACVAAIESAATCSDAVSALGTCHCE